METTISSMLEIVLLKLNQTYEIESAKSEVRYADDTVEINTPVILPIGSFIKISGARYNNGIFQILEAGEGNYKLDRALMTGTETAVITALNIPFGLLTIVKKMCIAADEIGYDNVISVKRGDASTTFGEEKDIFKIFSSRLAAYRRLKTL